MRSNVNVFYGSRYFRFPFVVERNEWLMIIIIIILTIDLFSVIPSVLFMS